MGIKLNYLKNLSWSDRGFLILCMLLCLGMIGYSIQHGLDFHVFYLAGTRALRFENLYRAEDDWTIFKYHPFWAIFFSVWALIPEKISLVLFNLSGLFCWGVTATLWAKRFGWELNSWKSRFVFLFLCFNPLSAEMGYGQVNGVIFLIISSIILFLESSEPKSLRAGILLAFLVSLKLNFGLIGFYVLFRKPKALLGAAIGAILLHLVVAVYSGNILGGDLYYKWISVMTSQSSAQFQIYEVQGILRPCLALWPEGGKILWLGLMLIFIAVGWVVEKKNTTPAAKFSYWMAGIFIFSPLAWWYQILYIYPMVFLLLKSSITSLEKRVVWVCLLVFALVTFNTLGREGIIWFKEYLGYLITALVVFAIFLRKFYQGAFLARPSLIK